MTTGELANTNLQYALQCWPGWFCRNINHTGQPADTTLQAHVMAASPGSAGLGQCPVDRVLRSNVHVLSQGSTYIYD
jgi:hypothetical protein